MHYPHSCLLPHAAAAVATHPPACRAWLWLHSSSTTAALCSESTRGPGRSCCARTTACTRAWQVRGGAAAGRRWVPWVCPVGHRGGTLAAAFHSLHRVPLIPLPPAALPPAASCRCRRGRRAALQPGRVQGGADVGDGAQHRGRGVGHGLPAARVQGACVVGAVGGRWCWAVFGRWGRGGGGLAWYPQVDEKGRLCADAPPLAAWPHCSPCRRRRRGGRTTRTRSSPRHGAPSEWAACPLAGLPKA